LKRARQEGELWEIGEILPESAVKSFRGKAGDDGASDRSEKECKRGAQTKGEVLQSEILEKLLHSRKVKKTRAGPKRTLAKEQAESCLRRNSKTQAR